MENKKTNAPANAVQSILQEQTNANRNSGQQDDYNKPAAINQEVKHMNIKETTFNEFIKQGEIKTGQKIDKDVKDFLRIVFYGLKIGTLSMKDVRAVVTKMEVVLQNE